VLLVVLAAAGAGVWFGKRAAAKPKPHHQGSSVSLRVKTIPVITTVPHSAPKQPPRAGPPAL